MSAKCRQTLFVEHFENIRNRGIQHRRTPPTMRLCCLVFYINIMIYTIPLYSTLSCTIPYRAKRGNVLLYPKRWIDCALGSATGVYHVSKFNSSVRTISSPDITRFSSSSISCTSENDFSGFGTCAQHGNIGSQAVRAEPAFSKSAWAAPRAL